MTQKDIKKLVSKLPPDGRGIIAVKSGFTRAYVNMVLSGTKSNMTIIDIAIDVAAQYQNDLSKKVEAINSL